METAIIELAGVLVAFIALMAAGLGVVMRMNSRIVQHEARIAQAEIMIDHIASLLERTTLIVAKLEERTKND